MDDLEAKLVEAVADRTGSAPGLDDDLNRLGLDSVDMANFVREIEDRFHIRVDEEIFDVQTLEELARYIRERQ